MQFQPSQLLQHLHALMTTSLKPQPYYLSTLVESTPVPVQSLVSPQLRHWHLPSSSAQFPHGRLPGVVEPEGVVLVHRLLRISPLLIGFEIEKWIFLETNFVEGWTEHHRFHQWLHFAPLIHPCYSPK